MLERESQRADALRTRLELLSEGEAPVMDPVQLKRLRRVKKLHDLLNGKGAASRMSLAELGATLDTDAMKLRERVADATTRREAQKAREARMNPDLDIQRDVHRPPSNTSMHAHEQTGAAGPAPQLAKWKPKAELLSSDTGRVPFIPDQVMYPAEDDDELDQCIQQQRRICRGCRNPLKKQGLFTAKYEARFCHYTGYYYCRSCHTNAYRSRIPARCLVDWDFDEYHVHDKAGEYLSVITEQPLFCISAHRPQLYDQCPLLATCRQVRLQLSMMYDIGKECPRFMTAFFNPPRAPQMQTSLHDDGPAQPQPAYVPADKLYLVEDSECWSLSDLHVFKQSVARLSETEGATFGSPSSPARGRKGIRLSEDEQKCAMLQYLRRLRSQMVRHIAHGCAQRCHRTAAKACGACTIDEVLYSFDIDNVVTCPRCDSSFHRHCWETKVRNGCPNCAASR